MKSFSGSLFPSKDLPLRQDVSLLGRLLGEVLQEQAGRTLFDRVESARYEARKRRESGEADANALEAVVKGLPAAEARKLVRAFSIYFELINMAERVHRIRRRRAYLRADAWPQPGSLSSVIGELLRSGKRPSDIENALAQLVVSPVFTAHPTEATRRTLLVKEQRIARSMVKRLESGHLLSREEELELAKIKNEIALVWQTAEYAHEHPTVADEVEHVVFYMSEVVYRIVPAFFDELNVALNNHLGSRRSAYPKMPRLRFGSWVGGDMDGNPNVGAATIRATLQRHRQLVVAKYLDEIRNLIDHMSQSATRVTVSDALSEQLARYRDMLPDVEGQIPKRYSDMPYRIFLWHVGVRLERGLAEEDGGYASVIEFRNDLELVEKSLKASDGGAGGLDLLERLQHRVDTFGFHLATLDVRQDAMVHRQVLGTLLNRDDFVELKGEQRRIILESAFKALAASGESSSSDRMPMNVDETNIGQKLSDDDSRLKASLDVMRAIRTGLENYGSRAIGPYIVSMTQGADDALGVLYLARVAGLVDTENRITLDVAPLLETVPDLENGPHILRSLFTDPRYRSHLSDRGNKQIVMLGYSDSNKESGIVASRWALHEAQVALLKIAKDFGVRLVFFHGRGGSVSRGGSRPRHAILAEPPGAINGYLRVTEQGEIIHAKYGLRDIALRTLELTAGASLEATIAQQPPPPPAYRSALQEFAKRSREVYRALVDDSFFFDYFRTATPIDVIERLRIGSRPASRRAKTGIENLRAIPWVFSWTQARHLLVGWYGFGSGFHRLKKDVGIEVLREMISEWRFFDTLVSDVEMTLAKADMGIAAHYAALAGTVGQKIFPRVQEEYRLAVAAICELREVDELLARDPILRRAIRLRNPYVDPMTFIQLDLLPRWRGGDRQDRDLEEALISTVQGIARGMRNTG